MSGEAASKPYDAIVDARGLLCPLPLVKARQALMVLDSGARIMVLATDPAAAADFEELCAVAGHDLVSIDEADGVIKVVLDKA